MNSIFRPWYLAALVLVAGNALAEDRIPWVADYNAACGMAAEQRRLVLLHFYNDNCGPCVRLDQNVFSKTEVADAVSQNYLAVKVHAGKNPQLATRYHINQWPTDVFVTASGLEVYRTVSPQKPAEYIALLNHVAVQSGASATRLAHNPMAQVAQQPAAAAPPQANSYWQPAPAAPTQPANTAQQAPTSYWQPVPAPAPAGQATTSQFQPQSSNFNTQPAASNPAQIANNAYLQPAAGAVANGLSGAMAYAEQRTQQATSPTQSVYADAQQKWNAATQQAQSGWDQARTTTDNTIRQATATAEQTQQQWSATAQQSVEQATAAVQNTQQQATAAVQQTTESAKRWTDETTAAVQRYEQQMGDAYKQFRDRTTEAKEQVQQTSEQIQQQAVATKQEWQTTANQASQDVSAAAQNLKQQASALTSSLLDRRSSFMPAEASPAAPATPAPAASGFTAPAEPVAAAPAAKPEILTATVTPPASQVVAATPSLPASTAPQLTETPAVTVSPAPAVTSNPWIANKQPEATKSSSFAPPLMPTEPSPSISAPAAQVAVPPTVTAVPQPVATAPVAPAAPVQKPAEQNFGNHQMVPVSQAPQLALDGFCPVTLMDAMSQGQASKGAWKKGSKQFGAIHNGRTYLFASAESQQKFLTNPDAYAPILSGCDPVVFTERGKMVEGKRAYGIISPDKHMYLFADETSRSRFERAPAAYTAAVQQAMARNAGGLHR